MNAFRVLWCTPNCSIDLNPEWCQGSEVQGSTPPLAAEVASLIGKKTLKNRISNVEVRHSIYFIKRLSKAKPHFEILRFDIRNSAVRCLINLDHRNSQFDPMGDINLLSLIRGVRGSEVQGFRFKDK